MTKLDDYNKWFTGGYNKFVGEYGPDSKDIAENVRYEKIAPATRVRGPNGEFLFFHSGRLMMVYTSDESLAEELWREFRYLVDVRMPDKIVRSRAGKTSSQHIFARHGFTVSMKNDVVDFIEVYPPCSLQDYLDNIYNEPGLFIR